MKQLIVLKSKNSKTVFITILVDELKNVQLLTIILP